MFKNAYNWKFIAANIIPFILTFTPTKVFLYLVNEMLQVILKINNPILSEKDDAIQQKGREKIIFPQYNWFVIKVWKAIKGMHQTIFKGLWLFKNTFGNIIVLITSLLPLNLLLLTNDTNEQKFYNLFQLKYFYSRATCKKLE